MNTCEVELNEGMPEQIKTYLNGGSKRPELVTHLFVFQKSCVHGTLLKM